MTTFPAGWRPRAEALLLAARRFLATTRADLRDLWARIATPRVTPTSTSSLESSTVNAPESQRDRWAPLRALMQQVATLVARVWSTRANVGAQTILDATALLRAEQSTATAKATSQARVRAARE